MGDIRSIEAFNEGLIAVAEAEGVKPIGNESETTPGGADLQCCLHSSSRFDLLY